LEKYGGKEQMDEMKLPVSERAIKRCVRHDLVQTGELPLQIDSQLLYQTCKRYNTRMEVQWALGAVC
jgi:hypothetical protein